MKVREVIKLIEEDGWYLAGTRGSHRQFKHPTKSGLVTIAGKLSAVRMASISWAIRRQSSSSGICSANVGFGCSQGF